MSTEREIEVGFALAEADYDALGDDERARLKARIWKFVQSGGRQLEVDGFWVGSRAEPPSDDDLSTLCEVMRRQLTDVASGVSTTHHYNYSVGVIWASDGSVIQTVVDGSIVDRFLLAFWRRFQGVGTSGLRQCPVCRRPFLKVRKRKFCDRDDCKERRAKEYWSEYTKTPNARRARQKEYDKHGWIYGARKRKKVGKSSTRKGEK